ncbi:Leucine rich repeat containing protein BspA family protein [Entamoeba marina]
MSINNYNKKLQLDSYSILICSKYFKSSQDFINLICVNSKFKETTEKLRFNPIPIKSLKLFPKIQTQYLYSTIDVIIYGINNYEIWYEVDYKKLLEFKKVNFKCHQIKYTKFDKRRYGNEIPKGVTLLGYNCFSNCSLLTSINLPSSLTSFGYNCFSGCNSLSFINLPSKLISLDYQCFYGCSKLSTIKLPSSLTSLGDGCFSYCKSLISITLPLSLISVNSECFRNCRSLTTIKLPSSLTSLGSWCFYKCVNLTSIEGVKELKIGTNCFGGCYKLQTRPNNSN